MATSTEAAACQRPRSAPTCSTPGAAIRQRSTGSRSCERCRRRPGRPSGETAKPTRVRQPRPPGAPGTSSTTTSRVDAGRAAQLLGDQAGLERALAGEVDVLPVAAAAAARPGVRAGRLDPVGRGLEHRGRRRPAGTSRSPEVTRARHPLVRQRVPDEDHPAVGGAGDAGAAGRGRAGGQLAARSRPGRQGAHVRSLDAGRARSLGVRRRQVGRLVAAPVGGLQLVRHAGHHHAGLEQQPGLQPQGALVVQQLLPPAADDVLRDVDGDHVARALEPVVADVLEDRPGDLAVRRGEDRQRDVEPAGVPLLLQRLGLVRVDGDRQGGEVVRPGRLGVGERAQRRRVDLGDQHDRVVARGQRRVGLLAARARPAPGRSAGGSPASSMNSTAIAMSAM